MIEKNRLQELIEQGATIYSTHYDYKEIKLNNDFKVEEVWSLGDCLVSKSLVFSLFGISLIFLFETKEDAEEYAEFGNITRMERLELPSWEDVNHKERIFVYKFHIKDNFDGFGKLMIIKDSSIMVQCSSLGVLHQEYFDEPFTKENYDKARRLCVKLFKGEKV